MFLHKFTELAEILPPIRSPIRQRSVFKQVHICHPEEEKTGDVKGLSFAKTQNGLEYARALLLR